MIYNTGTIIYENDQQIVSGLKSYSDPYIIQTGVRFAVVDRTKLVRKGDEAMREQHDVLTVQFGWNEIKSLQETGIYLNKPGRVRLIYDGSEFRAVDLNDYGRPYNSKYMNFGLIEVIFERRTPSAD